MSDVAWAAGLFEGEGSLRPKAVTSGELSLGMTDLDVIERFYAIVGVGAISRERRRPPHNDLYKWYVCNTEDVRLVLNMFLPWLGQRRGDAAMQLLERMSKSPGRNRDGKRYLRTKEAA